MLHDGEDGNGLAKYCSGGFIFMICVEMLLFHYIPNNNNNFYLLSKGGCGSTSLTMIKALKIPFENGCCSSLIRLRSQRMMHTLASREGVQIPSFNKIRSFIILINFTVTRN